MNNLSRDIDRIFSDFMAPQRTWHPVYDIEESNEQYLMTLDMPGVPRDQIKLETLGNKITVSGERKGYGRFQRVFSVPPATDTEKVEARYQDGVLSIRVPKPEAAKPRQIAIMDTAKQLA